jgi:hypothetical protein
VERVILTKTYSIPPLLLVRERGERITFATVFVGLENTVPQALSRVLKI